MPNRVKEWAKRKVRADHKKTASAEGDAKVVETIRREAKENGATLKNDGEGGLDPKIALEAFRDAGWRCENEHCPTPQEELDLDHESGHPREIFESEEAWKNPELRDAVEEGNGKKDNRFVHVLCALCHDLVHQRERAIEHGKEPPPMRGT